MPALISYPINSLGALFPATVEGNGPTGNPPLGFQTIVSVPMGPPLLVNTTTYQQAAFVAPCNGCYIKEAWLTAIVAIGTGTHTFAMENYDKSGTTGVNALSTTNIDPAASVTAKQGTQLTLTTTAANRLMDEGDVLWATLVTGTQGTAGQGYVLTAVFIIPSLI